MDQTIQFRISSTRDYLPVPSLNHSPLVFGPEGTGLMDLLSPTFVLKSR